MSLTQSEFDYLKGLDKAFKENDPIYLGPPPMKWVREITSSVTKEIFLLDFYRGSIEVKKFTYNKRYRNAIVLLRYDSLGRHTNPPEKGGEVFSGPHVHIYQEGFDDKCAFPVSDIGLVGNEGIEETLRKILSYFNIAAVPDIQTSLI